MQPIITVSLPCYKKPERTKRAIQSVIDQTINGMEVFVTGDCCPFFDESFNNWFAEAIAVKEAQGNEFYLDNLQKNEGGWGYDIRNWHIKAATGKYFVFMGNDDIIKPDHLKIIVERFELSPQNDFMYFDTWVEPYNAPRNTWLKESQIGHSELIVKTEFLKTMPPHEPVYGHDWKIVQNMMSATEKHGKITHIGGQYYIVKSVPGIEEVGID